LIMVCGSCDHYRSAGRKEKEEKIYYDILMIWFHGVARKAG
jgi:hypothetical protein